MPGRRIWFRKETGDGWRDAPAHFVLVLEIPNQIEDEDDDEEDLASGRVTPHSPVPAPVVAWCLR